MSDYKIKVHTLYETKVHTLNAVLSNYKDELDISLNFKFNSYIVYTDEEVLAKYKAIYLPFVFDEHYVLFETHIRWHRKIPRYYNEEARDFWLDWA